MESLDPDRGADFGSVMTGRGTFLYTDDFNNCKCSISVPKLGLLAKPAKKPERAFL